MGCTSKPLSPCVAGRADAPGEDHEDAVTANNPAGQLGDESARSAVAGQIPGQTGGRPAVPRSSPVVHFLNPVTAGLAEDPAEYLNKHPVAVTNWVMRGVRRRSEDLETAAGIEALDRKLCERSGGKD